jgi:MarR family transcriptional regulator, lower aerobic nicotinate degradation pathway regulator
VSRTNIVGATYYDEVVTTRSANVTKSADRELSTTDALAQLAFLIHNTLERLADEHDLSIIQTRLLGILRDRTPTMNELAKLLSLDKSSITGLVDRAERRGLVERVPSSKDRRITQVKLTKTGRSLVTRTAARFDADVKTILDCLPTSDRRALSTLASRLLVAHAAKHGIDLFPTTEPT